MMLNITHSGCYNCGYWVTQNTLLNLSPETTCLDRPDLYGSSAYAIGTCCKPRLPQNSRQFISALSVCESVLSLHVVYITQLHPPTPIISILNAYFAGVSHKTDCRERRTAIFSNGLQLELV